MSSSSPLKVWPISPRTIRRLSASKPWNHCAPASTCAKRSAIAAAARSISVPPGRGAAQAVVDVDVFRAQLREHEAGVAVIRQRRPMLSSRTFS